MTVGCYNQFESMRRGFSPTRSKVMQQLSARQEQDLLKLPISKYSNYNKYFCHYNNAVYMGGMSSYKKHGKGILLHDDGSAVVTEYTHDTPAGHTIIFRQNSIASLLYKTNVEFQVAYKQGKYIITIPFTDSSFKAHGVGVLIDYVDCKLFRLVFKRGTLVEKILHLNKADNDQIFAKNAATKIIGVKHEQAFNLNFEKPSRVHIKKEKNKTTIGYFDEDGQTHGLGFTFYGQNVAVNGERGLYLKFIEKGYYRNSQLQTFGEKVFSNGNKYMGEFDKGEFHGVGILISPVELKWVYGKFYKGQLGEIIESNYKRFTEKEFEVWSESLRHIHRRYKERWIDMDIDLPEEKYLYRQLKQAVEKQLTHIDPDENAIVKQDEERLTRIQQQFQKQHPGDYHHSFVQQQLDRHYTRRSTPRGVSRIDIPEHNSRLRSDNSPPTPIHSFQLGGSRRMDPKIAEQQYQMEDPFKIDLIKVPEDTRPPAEDYRQQLRRTKTDQRPSTNNQPYRSYRRQSPTSSSPYNYGYRDRYQNLVDSVYRQNYEDQLRQQRERLNRLSEQDYNYRLRRGLEESPIHRNYYTSPSKSEEYPQRYVGKLTNKRNFKYDDKYDDAPSQILPNKYPTTSKYYPQQGPNYQRDRSPYGGVYRPYGQSGLGTSPSSRNEEIYGSRKTRGISPKEDEESRRNFIKNNYKYWSLINISYLINIRFLWSFCLLTLLNKPLSYLSSDQSTYWQLIFCLLISVRIGLIFYEVLLMK